MKRPKLERRSETPLAEMRVTTIAFPKELHARLHEAAYAEGVVIAQIIREACKAWLDRYEKRSKS